MNTRRLLSTALLLLLALPLTGCRDWETVEWRATPVSMSGFIGDFISEGEPEVVSEQLMGDVQWYEVRRLEEDGTVVQVRLIPRVGLRPVIVGESDASLDVEVRVQRDGVWTEQPPPEVVEITQLARETGTFGEQSTTRTDRYTARIVIGWPSLQEEIELTLDLEHDLERPEPADDDDDDDDWWDDDDYYDC